MTQSINVLKPHVSINVTDVQASIAFYRKMFGVEPVKVRTGYAKFDLDAPGLNFAMNEIPSAVTGGRLSHLGIQVASTADVAAMHERWVEAGLVPREEKDTACCYARQDKAWVRDPDGNEWEVFTILEDQLPEASKADSSCCTPAAAACKAS